LYSPSTAQGKCAVPVSGSHGLLNAEKERYASIDSIARTEAPITLLYRNIFLTSF
jgi:hypothetical protein